MSLMDRISWNDEHSDPLNDVVVLGITPLRYIAEQIQMLTYGNDPTMNRMDMLAGLKDVEKCIEKYTAIKRSI